MSFLTDLARQGKAKEFAAKLTQQDRCDRCPASAGVSLVLPSGRRLDFCIHHHDRNKDAYPTGTKFAPKT